MTLMILFANELMVFSGKIFHTYVLVRFWNGYNKNLLLPKSPDLFGYLINEQFFLVKILVSSHCPFFSCQSVVTGPIKSFLCFLNLALYLSQPGNRGVMLMR